MSNKIILKKSSVPSKVPLSDDLVFGELAINYADGKLYYKNTSNQIASFEKTTFISGLNIQLRDTTDVEVELINLILSVYGRAGVIGVSV
jgi:hypothetical protein